jgi:hypothetical protein
MYDAPSALHLLPPARSQPLGALPGRAPLELERPHGPPGHPGREQLGDTLHVHGAYLLGKDTTVVAKTAKRMPGVPKWKDHSDTADRGAYLLGPHWNLVGLISQWESRWLCWPLVMRLVPGLKGARQWRVGDTVEPMSFWDAAIAAILEVTRCLGEASIRVVAAAYYSKAPLLNGRLARGIHVSSRLRKDAVGWDDPNPRPPGTRGRKPRHGRQWTLASLLSVQTPTRERLTRYGKLTEVVCVSRDVWLRDVAQKVRVVVLEGAKEPFILGEHGSDALGAPEHRDLWSALLD